MDWTSIHCLIGCLINEKELRGKGLISYLTKTKG